MYVGEIMFGNDSDIRKLRRLGVKMLRETKDGAWECQMSEETLRKLNPRWGEFFWVLRPVKQEAGVTSIGPICTSVPSSPHRTKEEPK